MIYIILRYADLARKKGYDSLSFPLYSKTLIFIELFSVGSSVNFPPQPESCD